MTRFQLALVGVGLMATGIGLVVYGWCSHTPDAVTFGSGVFGFGLGAVGIKRPTDA